MEYPFVAGATMLFALLVYLGTLIPLPQAAATAAKTNEKTPPPCTVSGRVVTAADAAPLKSAQILLASERQEQGTPQAYTAKSDADGRFTIKDVPAGRYQFFASHAGFVNQPYQASPGEKSAILALRSGQEIKDVLFRMIPAAVVTGRVTDEDGEAMEHTLVLALRRPSEDETEDFPWLQHRELGPAAVAQTDDRGEFRLFGLRPGTYFIRAEDDPSELPGDAFSNQWRIRASIGSRYAPIYYPGVAQLSQAQPVTVSPGAEATADFILRHTKMIELSGRVIGVDGKPATDASVFLTEPQSPAFYSSHDSDVNTKGEFKLRGVPPGSYVLQAQQTSSSDQNYRAQQNIEVGEDNIDSVTLVLGRGVKVSGHVTVATGAVSMEHLSISLQVSDADYLLAPWAHVKNDGSFEMVGVPEGTLKLEVFGLGEEYYVQSARSGRQDVLNNGLEVDSEKGFGLLQVVLSNSGAHLEGTVTQDEAPVVGVRVRVTPVPETAYNKMRAQSTTTDQSGHFTFSAVGPGKYKVVAKTTAQDGAKPAASDPQSVSLSENEHKEIALTLKSLDGQ